MFVNEHSHELRKRQAAVGRSLPTDGSDGRGLLGRQIGNVLFQGGLDGRGRGLRR